MKCIDTLPFLWDYGGVFSILLKLIKKYKHFKLKKSDAQGSYQKVADTRYIILQIPPIILVDKDRYRHG